jgi:hypothetical protein
MNCRIVIDRKGEEFQLTEKEEKFVRALEKRQDIS